MIEKQILGGIIVDPSIMDEVADFIMPQWFNPPYDKVWNVISDLYAQNLPIDSISILEQSNKKGYDLSPLFISQLGNEVFSSANVEYHAKVLSEQYLKREFLKSGEESAEKVSKGEDIFEVIEGHTQKMLDLTVTKQEHGAEVSQVMVKVLEHIDRVHSGKNEGAWLETGFYELDDKLKTMNGEFVVIAARPSMGKTSLALNVMSHTATKNPTGMCSLEMAKFQLTTRLLSTESGISYLPIITGNVPQDKAADLTRASSRISKLRLFIDDESAITPIQLRSKAMRMKKRYGITSLWVDYLQLMRNPLYGSDRTREVGSISRSLKALAKDLDIPVIALAQLNRGVEGRTSKMPQLSDLRESGEIEQDADSVIFLYRPEYYGIMDYEGTDAKDLCVLNIAKNRNGATGDVLLKFYKNTMKFGSIEHFI